MSEYILDFEEPLKKIDDQIDDLKKTSYRTGIDVASSIDVLEQKLIAKKREIYGNLTRWQKLKIARHPNRPYSSDYIRLITDVWYELHGDRKFSDDPAIISGIGEIDSKTVMIIAQEKGRGTKEKLKRNFGMTRPEGYRKALRVMKLAEKFDIPILTLIDTPGAYPGIGAEERGQAEAIARNIFEMSTIKVPVISIVIGEGASGGALAIGVCDRLLCMENTWFSVISPEGCASILFRDPTQSKKAANAMRVTAQDLLDMEIADSLIKEPLGGANNNYKESAEYLKSAFLNSLSKLKDMASEDLINERIVKYDKMGCWITENE
tara:strand:+ start:207 stop:1172 length:966 start_codon:yes stop_codon:yes gene_type:complete